MFARNAVFQGFSWIKEALAKIYFDTGKTYNAIYYFLQPKFTIANCKKKL